MSDQVNVNSSDQVHPDDCMCDRCIEQAAQTDRDDDEIYDQVELLGKLIAMDGVHSLSPAGTVCRGHALVFGQL